jgi:hypothetical protein
MTVNQWDDRWVITFEDGQVEEVTTHPNLLLRISDKSGLWEFMLGEPTPGVERSEELLRRRAICAVVSSDGGLTLYLDGGVSIEVETAEEFEAWEIRHEEDWAIFALPGGGFSYHGIGLDPGSA